MSQFALAVKAFAEKAKGNANQVVRKTVIDVGTSVTNMTPVGDASLWKSPPPKGYVGGRARANWQYGENVVPTGTLENIDATGQASVQRILSAVASDAAGKMHYIANNLPYMERLENGWSKQAPGGMVAITVVRWNAIVDQAVNGAYDRSAPGMAAGFEAYKV